MAERLIKHYSIFDRVLVLVQNLHVLNFEIIKYFY